MGKSKYILIILFFIVNSTIYGESNYLSYSQKNNVLIISTNNGNYKLSSINKDVIKVEVTKSSNKIYSINKSEINSINVSENLDYIFLNSGFLKVKFSKKDVTLEFFYKGKELLQEEMGFFNRNDTLGFRFYLKPEEKIFGTGSRSIPMNRRGYKFQCYNQANYGYGENAEFLNYSIPHVLSSEKYMLLFDNPSRAYFDIAKTSHNIMEYGAINGNMTYYLIAGDSYKSLIDKYTTLTGKQNLLPIWAYGNLQSRFGYKNQKEVEYVVDEMIKNGYPLDAIIIDLYWFGQELQNGKMGNLSWDKKYWPNQKKMISDFKKKGVKTILVSEPFFTKKSKHFKYLDDNKLFGLNKKGKTMLLPNFYFGEAALLDIFKPEAKDWFWEQYVKLKDMGVEGWWGDLGEPEIHPDSMVHTSGLAVELHGVYGDEWVKSLYNKYAEVYPNERLFMLGRAGFAGSQKYGLVPWSGDVGRSESGLRAQLPVMLGAGLSGLGYMHSDAGGFAGGKKDSILYTRWLQFATFIPIFRPHGDNNAPVEPIFYDQSTQRIIKKFINLRYRLLPYNYTLAWQNKLTGIPLARAMFLEYENLTSIEDQYFWGESMLIAPILDLTSTVRNVFLPKGYWFNYWTNKVYSGDRYVTEKVDINTIPIYIKAGSFIPYVNKFQTTDNYSTKELQVDYYYQKSVLKSNYKLYLDDGKTKHAFEKGEYQIIEFNKEVINDKLVITVELKGGIYKNMPKNRVIKLRIINFTEPIKNVLVNGEEVKVEKSGNFLEIKLLVGNKTKVEII